MQDAEIVAMCGLTAAVVKLLDAVFGSIKNKVNKSEQKEILDKLTKIISIVEELKLRHDLEDNRELGKMLASLEQQMKDLKAER